MWAANQARLLLFGKTQCRHCNHWWAVRESLKRFYINSPRDVIIYELKKPTRFYRVLTVAAIGQWLVTGYMSLAMFQSMPAFFSWIPTDPNHKQREGSTRLPLADWKYRAGFSLFTFSASTAILVSAGVLSLRSVTSITLMKNSSNVLIETLTPIGTPHRVVTPIMEISAIQQRSAAIGNIPLRLKEHRFHFLVDKLGHFPQPSLFDRTVGIARDFGMTKK